METLRTSSYLIPVKLESEPGKYMLIHGYTGAIDIVTESLLKKIQVVASGVDLPEDTLQTLIKRGYITTRSQEEEINYVNHIAKVLHHKEKLLYKYFTFIVSYNCNFRCPYCFEERKKKDGKLKIAMTKEMVDKAYQAMEKIEPQQQLHCKDIALYGGEPLLKENRDIVEYIVRKGCEKGYKFHALTNGYDLDAFVDLLSPELIYKLQITIDGTRDFHNQKRIHYRDRGTFDRIMSNIRLALNKNVEIVVRVNTDNQNIKDFASLKRYLEECGFASSPYFKMYSAMIWNNTSISEGEQDKLDLLSSKSYLLQNKDNQTLGQCRDFGIGKKIYTALTSGKSIPFCGCSCGAQTCGYVFDSLGDIYSCWEIVGNKDYKLGSYRNETIEWNQERLNRWHGYNITQNSICSKCKYALFCGGGCIIHTMQGRRDHCSYFRIMFDYAVNKAYKRNTN